MSVVLPCIDKDIYWYVKTQGQLAELNKPFTWFACGRRGYYSEVRGQVNCTFKDVPDAIDPQAFYTHYVSGDIRWRYSYIDLISTIRPCHNLFYYLSFKQLEDIDLVPKDFHTYTACFEPFAFQYLPDMLFFNNKVFDGTVNFRSLKAIIEVVENSGIHHSINKKSKEDNCMVQNKKKPKKQ